MERMREARWLVLLVVCGCGEDFTGSSNDAAVGPNGDADLGMDRSSGGGAGGSNDASSAGGGGGSMDASTNGDAVDVAVGAGGSINDARSDSPGTGDSHAGAGGSAGASGSGGSAGGGGTGGSAGGSEAGFDAAVRDAVAERGRGCPTNLPGRALVEISAPNGGSYCIDATEVTNKDYAAFVDAKGNDTSGQDAWCSWNTSYVPRDSWPTSQATVPVISVDWCDAFAYCKWAGKYLCGKIGGGSNLYADWKYAPSDAWYNACSAGGTRAFPYGNTYDGKTCNGMDNGVAAPLAVGEKTGCLGGYPGLFDMSGNIAEWEDSCTGTTGAMDTCRLRGGAFINPESDMRCDMEGATYRDYWYHFAGIRCCANSL